MRILPALGLAVLLAGCATITEGTSQSVAITTKPPGANCEVDRAGTKLGVANPTPGSIHVDKSKNDLAITCKEAGYKTATITESPEFNDATFGNIIAGGLVGAVVDASTGANYNYPKEVDIPFDPIKSVATAPSATASRTAISKPTS